MRSEVKVSALDVRRGQDEAQNLGLWDCCERLAAGDVLSRVRAARELLGWGECAVEPLIAELGSQEPAVRLAVIDALGNSGSRTAMEPLVAVLRDQDLSVRVAAALALGEIGDSGAIPALREALRDCFMARSAQTQRSVGIMLVPLVVHGLRSSRALIGRVGK
jgi:HEAT repeat protein